jgi:(1->4)-alpha-D-glucan 1-alpha-D-glucosylmutase
MPEEKDAQPRTDHEARLRALLEKTAALAVAERRFSEATYRLQFHAGFTFRDASRIIPYLHDLGITDCYASPYLKARAGSKHGYDISDHQSLNPELGTEADYDAFVQALQNHGMGQILDVVPNHMGIVGNENDWWNDVLENGPSARHAGYFDIDWRPIKPELRNKLLLGILGEPYGKVLESGHLTLRYEAGCFVVHYFENRFPVAPESSLLCLRLRGDELEHLLGKEAPELMEYQSILTALAHLPPRSESDPLKIDERFREKEVIKRRLATLTDACAPVREFIAQNVALFNGNQGDPHSFNLLDQLLNDQAYRLAFWKVTADEINYRRFFDVNELAALSMEKPEVFADTHGLILRLLAERKVTGLRIDHPDGLYDPKEYLERLQHHYVLGLATRALAEEQCPIEDFGRPHLQSAIRDMQTRADSPLRQPLYVVAEKILGKDERIPDDWAVHGTTGYEFLNMVNGLFVAGANEAAFNRIYHRATGMEPAFRPYVYEKKFLIMQVALSGELHMLGRQLDRLSEKDRWSRDFTLNSLRHALREIIACFPVYRSYITDEVLERDRQCMETAVRQAKRKNPAISSSLFDFVRDMLLLRYPEYADEKGRAEQRRFVGKFQQVTGPVMAKGLEDTAFYVYNRLVSLNEVGGDPGRFGVDPAELHAFLQNRQQDWPHALSASSTHDTKRSEDVRARLNVLSEMPHDWQKALARWKVWNKRHRVRVDAMDAPDRNDEYLLYQTLIGAWPLQRGEQRGEGEGARDVEREPSEDPPPSPLAPHPSSPAPGSSHPSFVERICAYMSKAIHEAKVNTSWVNPNPDYDDAVRRFVTGILDEGLSGRFLDDFRAFQARISHFGLLNSLAQTVLKLAAPGVPDFYQGTELWDFSLVDPDNRRPVDYDRRERLLNELRARFTDPSSLVRELLQQKEDGRIKLHVIWRGLQCRREHPGLFTGGAYAPASALGEKADHVFAFIRRQDEGMVDSQDGVGRIAVAAVPRMLTELALDPDALPLGAPVWQNTVLVLPGVRPGQRFQNAFTGAFHQSFVQDGQSVLSLADLFAQFPVALLIGR